MPTTPAQKKVTLTVDPDDTNGGINRNSANVSGTTSANRGSLADANAMFIGSPYEPRVTNGRRSFAAALWNPMSDEEKRSFNKRRFLQLVVGIFMAVMVGVQYAFGIVSNNLKQRAGFRQSDMTTITTVGNCLFAFSFPAGVLFDYAGPKPVLICAMVFGCTGFSLLAMIFAGVIEPTVATVAIANGLPNWQAGFVECAALLSNLFVFPTNKGEVVILQKTFFGLGSTFFSLSFDGFFSERDDFEGYCIYVACLIFFVVTIGAFITKLPAYKRTTRELNAIAKMSEEAVHQNKMMEEQSFEMHHNPRLSDRRRLNYGVTMLLITLVFFTSLSFIKAFIHIETNAILALTFVALACIISFAVMLYPGQFPDFFDYEFLPDIHPPEELVDQPEKSAKKKTPTNPASREEEGLLFSGPSAAVLSGGSVGDSMASQGSVGGANGSPKGGGYAAVGTANSRMSDVSGSMAGSPLLGGAAGSRASQLMPHRSSVAGGSMIAIPKAVAPMAIPSINTSFVQSLKHPFIWCFWFGTFAIMGTNFVFVNNITQIYVALNNGEFVKSSNSLNVALIGIGSAIGRICTGFGETYLHRINAIHRDRQLEHMARQELNLLTSDDVAPDMTPVYHRWNASIVMLLPLSPLVVGLMCLATLIVPPAALGVVLIVYSGFVGLYQTLLALSVREIFSVDVAKHLNFIFSSGIIATILLNRVMFGMWYDAEFDRQQGGSGNNDLVDGAHRYDTYFGQSSGRVLLSSFVGDSDGPLFAVGDNASTTASPITSDSTTTQSSPTTTTAPTVSTSTEVPTTATVVPSNTTTAVPHKVTECVGVSCVRNSFLVLAGINAMALVSVSFVVWHWWQVRKTF